jgi:hypothetical protein
MYGWIRPSPSLSPEGRGAELGADIPIFFLQGLRRRIGGARIGGPGGRLPGAWVAAIRRIVLPGIVVRIRWRHEWVHAVWRPRGSDADVDVSGLHGCLQRKILNTRKPVFVPIAVAAENDHPVFIIFGCVRVQVETVRDGLRRGRDRL